MEVRELTSEYEFPGDDLPIIQGSALGALNGEAQWEEKVFELANSLRHLHSRARACNRW